MNRSWLIGTAVIISAATVLLLPQLASLEPSLQSKYGALEVFGEEGTVLGNNNLVDLLGELPLTLSIDRVGWKGSVLSLDLKVTGNETEPQEIYQNMALAISFAFQETVNVDQLLLRIVAEDKWLESRRLLLAGDIRRSEWSPGLLEALQKAASRPLPESLKDGLRISESELWKKQFINP
ncbi:hypothetical protein [Paenibacillus sp. P46E]|uniref:hypothetical protein n=1 Tax=Paenibacillus sp. P46E TaxID=1349436 RepID=UPI00093F0FF7|nr:hypothetical protein [Paenibacillus sp. P46E]OKP93633.1 hypothetical protein A3849_31160 [Paenibacillus sp. P46E]